MKKEGVCFSKDTKTDDADNEAKHVKWHFHEYRASNYIQHGLCTSMLTDYGCSQGNYHDFGKQCVACTDTLHT